MKRVIAILLCFLMSTHLVYGNNVIDEILSRKEQKTSNADMIYKYINNSKTIKIISNEKEVEEEIKEKKEVDENAYIKGIDISKWNGDIDWGKVKEADIKFAIIRAGYGSNTIDKKFKQNIENAIKNDMIIGIYWFSYAYTDEMAIKEAEMCYKTIKPYKKHIKLPIFWDFEYDSVNRANGKGVHVTKESCSSMADNFCKTIEKLGFKSGIYTNIDYSRRYFTQEVLDKYYTWIAQWTSECTYKGKYILWQKSANLRIGGIVFDLNYLYYNRYEGDINEEDS